jgi:hypothetical protein
MEHWIPFAKPYFLSTDQHLLSFASKFIQGIEKSLFKHRLKLWVNCIDESNLIEISRPYHLLRDTSFIGE